MLKKLLAILPSQDIETRRAAIHQNILRDLAKMGGKVFGEIPQGTRREFFCLDRHTWVWHEEWTDAKGVRQIRTTRYDIRPQGIFKAQDGQPYQPVSLEEARRFGAAINEYQRRMHEKFDPMLAASGV
ncbi:hypothetical protein CSA80_02450 [Candidatus Saccharibacteria bacterium]|nr:MAG: hypothetical protein CSA80_02450 [Candidatus Saccharibacteria bacterium]